MESPKGSMESPLPLWADAPAYRWNPQLGILNLVPARRGHRRC